MEEIRNEKDQERKRMARERGGRVELINVNPLCIYRREKKRKVLYILK